ncbi:hypothetical protein BIV57_02145 [Mangrovactinospora gilvigrisea]|uniref:Uncharacterized protein n=1 Tax=Mangrovactinospora gilvigrisea TaxID=1428644 RepID=A0A1J7C0A1_9ACTN|nr:hypothetical protein [Mangrovactinospora gilvigrisea]OIV39153.1 hypothetical protein BIV57_02145 [Mangrovactinospora gilvigrisea]
MAAGNDDASDSSPSSHDRSSAAHRALLYAATQLVLTARPLATVPEELRPHLSRLEHALFACTWEAAETDPEHDDPDRQHLKLVE